MGRPLISVIMANYNTPIEYLKESVESILSQTYDNFEFIIIDDASTDSSKDYLKSLEDERIRLIENEENLGLTKSLNRGINAANGDYIARMDSDDISLPERFEKQIAFMEENSDVIVCGTWFRKFGSEDCVRKPVISDFEMYRCQLIFSNTPITICHPSVMMRKSMLDENNILYDEEIKKAQDYAMWVECSRFGRIAILEEILVNYRTHGGQISVKSRDEQARCSFLIFRKQMERLGITVAHTENQSAPKEFRYYNGLFEEIIEKNEVKKVYSQAALKNYKREYLTNLFSHMNKKDKLLVAASVKGMETALKYAGEKLNK